jgi:hypothetical protein
MACATCRYHSATKREKVLGVADEDMEIVAFSEDEFDTAYLCQHPAQQGRSMGVGEQAGEKCQLFEMGQKRGVSPALARRLAQHSK